MRKLILAAFILFLLLVGTVRAAEVVLQWGASIDAPLRYSVYKTETKGSYVLVSENLTVNNLIGNVAADVLTLTVTVPDTYRCWFIVTSTDDKDLESSKSNEVCYSSIPSPNAPPYLWGGPYTCSGDLNYDGDVDGADLAIFAAEFGRTDCAK